MTKARRIDPAGLFEFKLDPSKAIALDDAGRRKKSSSASPLRNVAWQIQQPSARHVGGRMNRTRQSNTGEGGLKIRAVIAKR